MKALIIAAGKGTRLNKVSDPEPKPLAILEGISLIERVILTSKLAGITDFIIVIGYLGDKIKSKLGNGEKLGVNIEYVFNDEYDKANGLSVFKAKNLLKENFILLMSDHIFHPLILKNLCNHKIESTVTLAVDRRETTSDDTKVLEKDGKIIEIGKQIKKFNCVDMGIFYLTPKIFNYLEIAIKKGKYELSNGIKIASQNKDAFIFDIKDPINLQFNNLNKFERLWIDVDTEDDYREAKKFIKQLNIKIAK